MEEINVKAGLQQLPECLREIRSLLAWAELERAGSCPGIPPSFRVDNHIEEDLRTACGFFLKTTMGLHEILNGKDAASVELAQRARWKDQLLRIEAEFQKLNIESAMGIGRFIKA